VIAAWESEGPDGDGSDIRARFYPVIFHDGFETGATERWSPPTPYVSTPNRLRR
jgi:hypothetical protein